MILFDDKIIKNKNKKKINRNNNTTNNNNKHNINNKNNKTNNNNKHKKIIIVTLLTMAKIFQISLLPPEQLIYPRKMICIPSENDMHLPRFSNILNSNNDASISAVNTLFTQNLNMFLYRGWTALTVVMTLCPI